MGCQFRYWLEIKYLGFHCLFCVLSYSMLSRDVIGYFCQLGSHLCPIKSVKSSLEIVHVRPINCTASFLYGLRYGKNDASVYEVCNIVFFQIIRHSVNIVKSEHWFLAYQSEIYKLHIHLTTKLVSSPIST